jgi:hypothetical protein
MGVGYRVEDVVTGSAAPLADLHPRGADGILLSWNLPTLLPTSQQG